MSTFVIGFLCGAVFVGVIVGGFIGWAVCSVSGPIEYDFR